LKNGKILCGELHLDHNSEIRKIGIEKIVLNRKARACPEALDRIKKADALIIGPGDLYGSILPNFLVEGIAEAILKSKAKVIYNCNLTNRKGQTDGFRLSDYVDLLEKYLGGQRIDLVTYNLRRPPQKILERYKRKEGKGVWVEGDDKKNQRKYKVVKADLLSRKIARLSRADKIAQTRSLIRHDPDRLAKVIFSLL